MNYRTDSLLFPFRPAGRRERKASSAGLIRWVGLAVLGLTALAVVPGQASGQGTVTTSDGLELSLAASGSVSSLKIGSTQYGASMPSGFFYREASSSAANLAVNGSFESGSGMPTGWSVTGGTGGTWTIDTANAAAGARSMKLHIPGSIGKRSQDLMTIAQFPLVPNTPYKLSVSMKTSGLSAPMTLYFVQQNTAGVWSQTGIQSLTGTDGWRTYAKTVFTGPNVVQGYLKAYISSGYGTVWLDDVRVNDVFAGDQPAAFGGTVTSSGGVLTQTANTSGLNFVAKYTSVGSAIKVDATLTDTTGADRGVEVDFRLPLDIAGWTWDKDFVTPTTIASGIRYENPNTAFATQTLGHTHSNYPFATVRNSTAAFSMAVPMGPLMDRFTYDDTQGFHVTYDVGLSTATTQSPSTAKFSFWIYTHNPKWGMRSAAEKYYALNPDSFTTTATVLGAWALKNTLPLSSVPNPGDFGWGYEEFDSNLAFDNAHGIIGMHYVSPTEWDISVPGYPAGQPAYTVLAAALTTALGLPGVTVDSIPTAQMAAAVVASAPYDQNGLHQLSYNTYFWYGNRLQMYPAVPYSTLPGGTYPLVMEYCVDNQIEEAQHYGNTLGGMFLDNISATFGNIENYRKSLWAHNAHGPLSFSYRTGETVQYFGDSIVDFTGALRSHLNGQGMILFASLTPGSYVWYAHETDVVGGEVGGAEVLDRTYARRTMSYGKVWSNLYVPGQIIPTQGQVLAYFRQGLLMGYFPGFNGLYWDSSPTYERDRNLFKLYMPVIKTVAGAGWKPVNYATSSSTSTLIERFGNPSGTFYVTAQNSGASITSVTLTLDGAGLGIPTTTAVTVTELLSNTTRAVTRTGADIKITETLDPGETVAYKVTLAVGGGDAPVANFASSPSNPAPGQSVQFTDTSTNTPTSWSWVFGDGGTSTVSNPTHTFTAAGSYQVQFTASNASGSDLAEYTVTVAGSIPVANYTSSPSNPTAGQSVQFTDTSTNAPTSWSWNFGDGGTSTAKDPAHTFVSNGSYRVKLTASNASGSSLGEKTVTVGGGVPVANFTYGPSNPAAGQSVSFTDTSTNNPTSWLWNFGDGATSTLKNPTHAFASGGAYRVKLTSANASGSSLGEKTVTVGGGIPVAKYTWSPSSPLRGQQVQFTDTSTGTPTSWSWTFGDGGTSTLKNPTHTFTTAGPKRVKLTARNASGSSLGEHTVTVR